MSEIVMLLKGRDLNVELRSAHEHFAKAKKMFNELKDSNLYKGEIGNAIYEDLKEIQERFLSISIGMNVALIKYGLDNDLTTKKEIENDAEQIGDELAKRILDSWDKKA